MWLLAPLSKYHIVFIGIWLALCWSLLFFIHENHFLNMVLHKVNFIVSKLFRASWNKVSVLIRTVTLNMLEVTFLMLCTLLFIIFMVFREVTLTMILSVTMSTTFQSLLLVGIISPSIKQVLLSIVCLIFFLDSFFIHFQSSNHILKPHCFEV